jgi:Spy/CpxP family protein refolding chaperone
MNHRVRVLVVCALLGVVPATLAAQRGGGRRNQIQQPPQGRVPADQRIGQLMKNQLQLSDAQTERLQDLMGRFQERRQGLLRDEQQARMTIREALCGGDSTRGAEVAKSLDQVIDIEKRRVQMHEDEQRELAGFLTPYQRARFMGFEEQLGALLLGRGAGGRAGRQGQPPDGPPNGPPQRGQGRAGRAAADVCANPVPPNAQGQRARGGDGQIPPSF